MNRLRTILQTVWGYDAFRPLQAEAMHSVLSGRDSVVVLPTGGGKSLCFQAPALAMEGVAVVVSPLIALMKDQVDGLVESGVAAACVHSMLSEDQRRQVADEVRSGRLKLLYLSPEKLMTPRTLQFLQQTPVSFFAIDEAHCISDWGHDFRPEYRMLSQLKEQFPGVAVHAYTATATDRVRADIVRELRLQNPEVLVGSFDRPNLTYRVQRRGDLLAQVREVIDRYPNDSGIIYCIRRADVDQLHASLSAAGFSAAAYHAGLADEVRRHNQDEFANDRARIMVATVAFGMGVDKSDVRYVIHTGAPKSLEHYQQESGRAGRDGLPAECCLLYTGADFLTWRKLQSELPPAAYQIAMHVLEGIEDFCGGATCRHRHIVQYFQQTYEPENCQACDVCLGEVALVEDALVIGQKILSCVLRVGEAFGGDYTAHVLAGSREQRIIDNGHEKLSTWGLLIDHKKPAIRDWIEQLVSQGFLKKTGEYNVLSVTPDGRKLLKGELVPKLLKPVERSRRETKVAAASWEGVDRGLFEALRAVRRKLAEERGLPPFIVMGDATLRSLARSRPSTTAALLQVHGIGEKKAAEYGSELVAAIADYCQANNLSLDAAGSADEVPERRPLVESASGAKGRAHELFRQGKSIDEVCAAVGRARSTVTEYLGDLILAEGISDPTAWIDPQLFDRIRTATRQHTDGRLKPLFEALGGEVPYDLLRIALSCLRNAAPEERE